MKSVLSIAVGVLFASCAAVERLPSGTNEVVHTILDRILYAASYDDLTDGTIPEWVADVMIASRTWPGFLGLAGDCGLTQDERKAAFARYLSALGTNDCAALPGMEKERVRIALAQCDRLHYAEAAPSYKALALNPKGIYRDRAIQLALKYSPVDDATTEFVEAIMTNSIGYAIRERSTASCQYASSILSFNATNESQRTVVANAVAMFYKNRMLAPNAFSIIDRLFVRYIDDYAMSSNRLEHALNALSLPDCGPVTKRKFTSVTNQLLSSGQPLPWINVGGSGN